jgi:hypothetical protein
MTGEPSGASSSSPEPSDVEVMVGMLERLPKEVGALLVSVGVLGMVLPGLVGTPALIAGGLVFWPKAFGPIEGWFGRKFPQAHHKSLEQIHRYLEDLEHRYPTAGNKSS